MKMPSITVDDLRGRARRAGRWIIAPTQDDGERTDEPVHWAERFLPLVLVAIPVVFNLVHLTAELRNAAPVNDYGVHRSWIEWAADRIRAGHLPLDAWVPNLANGVPQFRYYQTSPHIITALTEVITGIDSSIRWFTYLLIAAFPISIYGATRRFGLGRWTAATSALLSAFLVSFDGHGFETQSYIWRGRGLYSQLWAQMMLPWAIVLAWRALREGRRYGRAIAVLAVTCAFHLLQAYLVLLFLPLLFLLAPRRLERIPRLIAIGVGTLATASWVLVPVLIGSGWISSSEFNLGTYWADSYGHSKILTELINGNVTDMGRTTPWISLLAAAGAVICVVRWRTEAHRLILLFTIVGLCLWFGRPTWGAWLDMMPGGSNLIYHRFVFAVQLGMLWLAGVAGGQLVAGLRQLATHPRVPGSIPQAARVWGATAIAAVVLVAGLQPAFTSMRSYLSLNTEWIELQEQADRGSDGVGLQQALDIARRETDYRVYSGMLNGWGAKEAIYQSPLLNWNTSHFANTFGFNLRTLSLTNDIEPAFDDTNPAQFNLFNIHYWISRPNSQRPKVPAEFMGEFGSFHMWRIPTTGWLDVIDVDGKPIVTDNTHIGSATRAFIRSEMLTQKRFPQMMLDWQDVPTVASTWQPGVAAGSVESQEAQPSDGYFSGKVTLNRPAYVLLKQSFHGNWTAQVDGKDVDTVMVAPGFVAVPVDSGTHTVTFQYVPFQWYWLLFLTGAITLIVANDRRRAQLIGWIRPRLEVRNIRISMPTIFTPRSPSTDSTPQQRG